MRLEFLLVPYFHSFLVIINYTYQIPIRFVPQYQFYVWATVLGPINTFGSKYRLENRIIYSDRKTLLNLSVWRNIRLVYDGQIELR